MQCRNCGAEIADKALICYKCGTATTEAKYQPAEVRQPSARSRLVPTGRGSEAPLTPNFTSRGRATNRRVEARVLR